MALKVIGAGFGRTGTLSLKSAIEQLGMGKCYHMMEMSQNPSHAAIWAQAHKGEAVNWDALFAGYQAVVDWPACNFWREMAAHFQDAKILLSLRDPESWYKSVMNTIYPTSVEALTSKTPDPEAIARSKWAQAVIWNPVFDGRMQDKDHVIDVFNKHNQAVIDEVPADRLLVYKAAEGWPPLCEFLGVPVPTESYPKVNTTEQFHVMVKTLKQKPKKAS